MNTPTYTRLEAEQALGIKSRSAFYHLRRKYPQAFVITHQGTDRSNPTLYDKQALDRFIEWRKLLAEVSAMPFTPVNFTVPKKGR